MADQLQRSVPLKVVTVAAAVVVTVVGVFGVVFYSCAKMAHSVDGMCANEVLAEYPSPDGKRRVVVFERDCGATTDSSTQASVLGVGEAMPNEAGNVFVAKCGRAPSGRGGGPELRVRWLDLRRVGLSHHEGAAVFSALRECDGVEIAYETFR
jgi:hypothetical protein